MAYQVLRNGSRGPDVKVLQNLLNTALRPRPNLNPDSIFGNKTGRAVRAFQRDKKLVVNGVVDDRSWAALREGKENRSGLYDDISDYASEVYTIVKAVFTRATAARLEAEFNKFRTINDGRFPCRRSRPGGPSGMRVKNQCAVRMSVALCRAVEGDIFGNFKGKNLHSPRCCAGGEEVPHRHITSATDLKKYLQSIGYTFKRFENKEIIESHKSNKDVRVKIKYKRRILKQAEKDVAKEIAEQLGTQKGIIYFRHCFDNDGKKGSHIDYWNGTRYTNAAEGNQIDDGKSLFYRTDYFEFCRL